MSKDDKTNHKNDKTKGGWGVQNDKTDRPILPYRGIRSTIYMCTI